MKLLPCILAVLACAVLIAAGQSGPADPAVPDVLEAKDETIRLLEGENEQLKRELLFNHF